MKSRQLTPQRVVSTNKLRKALYFYKKDKELLDLKIKLNEMCESTFLTNSELHHIVRSVSRGNSPTQQKFRIRTETTNISSGPKTPQHKFKKFDFTTTTHLYFA
ncbi:unnamed protein product (macronuclear) [Paramecium tetraurelia]|uniref:Uncharacterized protein n=1 Tax=Paramecium tetraurelia TaxID=5888 RepID=A0CU86_PARTE|nr:uncharacterized protein GSPATT00010552001 [Paramecium tetraurelia]CAK74353.1 unnamed protein product [Paramecium tetraurelia]|eukprot:XP_001441750.1 hypothetical protein (macronuclear) [Paramecium tetraurelia strain d4-2]